jgi:hypothetical protein
MNNNTIQPEYFFYNGTKKYNPNYLRFTEENEFVEPKFINCKKRDYTNSSSKNNKEYLLHELIRLSEKMSSSDLIDVLLKNKIALQNIFEICSNDKEKLEILRKVFPNSDFRAVNESQFHLQDGKTACVSICTLTAHSFLLGEYFISTSNLPWKTIHENGIKLWKIIHGETKKRFHEIEFVIESFNNNSKSQLLIEKNYYGTVFEETENNNNTQKNDSSNHIICGITNVFEEFFKQKESKALILVLCDFAFAFLFNELDDYIIHFDSHGGIYTGHSHIGFFYNPKDVVSFLRLKFINNLSFSKNVQYNAALINIKLN